MISALAFEGSWGLLICWMCKVNDDIDGVWNGKLVPGDGCCEYRAHEQNGQFSKSFSRAFFAEEGKYICGFDIGGIKYVVNIRNMSVFYTRVNYF